MTTSDMEAFIQTARSEQGRFFDGEGPVTTARAPGRLDVMGGIADYSGSLVLECPLAESAKAGLQKRRDNLLRIRSLGIAAEGLAEDYCIPLSDYYSGGVLLSYEAVRKRLTRSQQTRWAAYLAGVFYVLLAEGLADQFPCGANLLLSSDVPLGAGVSSSAAIEVAAMKAVSSAFGIAMDGLTLARLCQMVENRVVGAPCGIMDQVTSALGEAGRLLILKCQPHEIIGQARLPEGCRVLGINSHVKHSVGGSRYKRVRVAAFMGLKILTESVGSDLWGGYLANITPDEYRNRYARILSPRMKGSDFLARYGETSDPVTRVDPEAVYSVRACTEHPIYENHRVQAFLECLQDAGRTGSERFLIQAGQQMYGSHWSYGKRCGLGSRETDALVNLVRKRGAGKGFYGAKITGGGSGGTAAVLVRGDVSSELEEIMSQYAALTGAQPQLFDGSSPGAMAFGETIIS